LGLPLEQKANFQRVISAYVNQTYSLCWVVQNTIEKRIRASPSYEEIKSVLLAARDAGL
jgi:hypothetical protein